MGIYNGESKEEKAKHRPLGLWLLPIIFIIFAVLSIMGSIEILNEALPMEYAWLSRQIWSYFWYLKFDPAILQSELNPLIGIDRFLRGFDVLYYDIFSGFIIAGIGVLSSIGLLAMKKWGRYLGLTFGIISIITSLSTIFKVPFVIYRTDFMPLLNIFLIIPGLITIVYLTSEVKYAFEQIDAETLVKDLNLEISSDRLRAAKVLGVIGDERAVEPLTQALEDSDWEVRAEAARALGRIGDERAVEPLTQALNDEHKSVSKVAGVALVQINKKMEKEREREEKVSYAPQGVLFIALFIILSAIGSFAVGYSYWGILVNLRVAFWIYPKYFAAQFLFYFWNIIDFQANSWKLVHQVIFYEFLGVALTVLTVGLVRFKNWARIGTIIYCVISIFLAIYAFFIPGRYDMHIGGIIYPLYNTNILIIPLFINTMFFEIGLGLVVMIIFNIAIEVAIMVYLLGKIKHEFE